MGKNEEILGVLKQLRALMDKLTDLNGNKTGDTKEPVFHGNGLLDVREVNGQIQIGIQTELGWVVRAVPFTNALGFAAAVTGVVAQSLVVPASTEAIAPANNTLH